jgi:hypothetical protein
MNTQAKVVKNLLSDRSIAWNVEYQEGTLNVTIGCVSQDAAELLAECLNEAAWIQADVGETV